MSSTGLFCFSLQLPPLTNFLNDDHAQNNAPRDNPSQHLPQDMDEGDNSDSDESTDESIVAIVSQFNMVSTSVINSGRLPHKLSAFI